MNYLPIFVVDDLVMQSINKGHLCDMLHSLNCTLFAIWTF